jgi:hypothetical protein
VAGSRSAARKRRGGRARWIAWIAVAVAAGIGAWWVVSVRTGPAPPLDDIDDRSRERLERVLREAERE